MYIPKQVKYITYYFDVGFNIMLRIGDCVTKGSFIIFSDRVYINIENEIGVSDNSYAFDIFEFRKKDNELIDKIGVYYNGG